MAYRKSEKGKIYSQIKKKIKKDILDIKKGFEIVFTEQDDCDEYGLLYWIQCENGWSGRDWQIDLGIKKSINDYLINLFEKGITFNKKKYYIYVPKNVVFPFDPSYKRIKFVSKNYFKKTNHSVEIRSVLNKMVNFLGKFIYVRGYYCEKSNLELNINLTNFQKNAINRLKNDSHTLGNILLNNCFYNKISIIERYNSYTQLANNDFETCLKKIPWYKYLYLLELNDKEIELFKLDKLKMNPLLDFISTDKFYRNDNIYNLRDGPQGYGYYINWLTYLDMEIGAHTPKTYLNDIKLFRRVNNIS